MGPFPATTPAFLPAPFRRVEFQVAAERRGLDGLVQIHPPAGHAVDPNDGLFVARESDQGGYWFCYRDGCAFRVSAAADSVEGFRPPEMADEDLLVYLHGPIMGFGLRLRGVVSLHASAVQLGAGAVAFVGAGGAGKSTLAARLGLAGMPVITDDVLPLAEQGGTFAVWCPVPQIKLWPESVARLCGNREALPKLVPTNKDWDKRFLGPGPGGVTFATGKVPLAAIHLLQPRSSGLAVPHRERVPPAEALMALTADSYVNYALSRSMRALEFQVLTQLVRTVPVWRLTLPDQGGELTELIRCLEGHPP